MTAPATPAPGGPKKPRLPTILIFCLPILLLAGVVGVFVFTDGAGLNITPAVPVESVQFGQTILRPGEIELHLRNTSPREIIISQININEATWPYAISPGRTVARLGSAVITLNYHWVQGEAYEITVFSSNSIPFLTSVPVATTTALASTATLWSFTLIGIYVGIIPVALGMFWLPALKRLGPRAMMFLMAATVGLLVYLGLDASNEALEIGATLSDAFQGTGIVGIGIAGTFLLLDAISTRQMSIGRSEAGQRMTFATMIAVGIGLHNLGEGLAIGAAYAVGAAALGTFLVVGFILQNITEGLGIIVPILRDRPKLRSLALLGLLGGGPAIAGTWIGGLVYSQPLSVLFLAIGAGAVFQVAYEISKQMIWKDAAKRQMPLEVFGGIVTGMLILYITGVAIK
ncbi:MAG: metal transporter [Acidobacteria bacterium]|nr:metal transporter [Acidobacteriota bacterium]